MVRTKGDGASKAVGAKALSKAVRSPGASSSRVGSSSSSKNVNDRYSGGNAYCPRPTPPWQKEITTFFTAKPKKPSGSSESGEGSSTQPDVHSDQETHGEPIVANYKRT